MNIQSKIAASIAAVSLLSACGNGDNEQPRDAADTTGEPAGQVGTLTDVPTNDGAAMQGNTASGSADAPASTTANPEDERQNTPTNGNAPGMAGSTSPTSSPTQPD